MSDIFQKEERLINIEIETTLNKEVIKNLLKLLYLDVEPNSNAWAILFDFKELMSKCKFNKKELHTIELLSRGFTETKIASTENISRQGINKRIDLIADKIYNEYILNIIC